MDNIQLFGKIALGHAHVSDYNKWATAHLVEGAEGMNLCELASLEESLNISSFEVQDLYKRSLLELNIIEPNSRLSLDKYAIFLCKELLKEPENYKAIIPVLYDIYLASDYDSKYIAWSDLDDAIKDIEAGSYPYSYGTATKENIIEIIQNEAQIQVHG